MSKAPVKTEAEEILSIIRSADEALPETVTTGRKKKEKVVAKPLATWAPEMSGESITFPGDGSNEPVTDKISELPPKKAEYVQAIDIYKTSDDTGPVAIYRSNPPGEKIVNQEATAPKKPAAKNRIKVGDIVVLKTGGPSMTVNRANNPLNLECVYFKGDDLYQITVAEECLAVIEDINNFNCQRRV